MLLCYLVAAVILVSPSFSAATDGFIYGGCSPGKFTPGSAYETNLHSLLSSLASATALGRYANSTVPPGGAKPEPAVTVYGVYQCRGDLDATSCSSCVSRAIAQVGALCLNAYSGFLQMESCFVRYDNSSFFGVQDKTLMLKKCAPFSGFDQQDALTRAGDVMGSLASGSEPYRTGGNGDVQGVAQCTGDLNPAQCQDCLTDAIGRLRSDCGMAPSGYVYLSKCYARFTSTGGHAPNFGRDKDHDDDNGIGKTFAIIIGIITLIILLVVFLAFLGKRCRKLQDEKWCT